MNRVVVLNILAVCFTVLRSWPQFLRIVIRKNAEGVSALTWSLAAANHAAWMVYGLVSGEPVLVVVNVLAGAGCTAIVWCLRSPGSALLTVAGASGTALAVYQLGEAQLLVAVVVLSLAQFVPQAIRVIGSDSSGVSPVAWTISALSSFTWLLWGYARGRQTISAAHFVMLPIAIFIAFTTWHRARRGLSRASPDMVPEL